MKNLKGLATGIGSLPYTAQVDRALDLIFACAPQIPFWPQLPKRGVREGMLAQFSENLPCLRLRQDGVFFDGRAKEKELELFYSCLITDDRDYFKITPAYAAGLHAFYQRLQEMDLASIQLIKCHITGPFTFAASLQDQEGKSLLHDPVMMQAIIKGLLMKALWQVELFKEFGKQVLVFIDEPYLGCFGSAYTPINKEDVVSGLAEMTDDLRQAGALSGVHCCGNTDWSILTDISTLDMINFDAFGFQEKFVLYADNLKAFFSRGGMVCWGIVPTMEFSVSLTPQALVNKIQEGVDALVRKGLDKQLILNNLLISPSCGLGNLEVAQAENILRLLSETSILLKKP